MLAVRLVGGRGSKTRFCVEIGLWFNYNNKLKEVVQVIADSVLCRFIGKDGGERLFSLEEAEALVNAFGHNCKDN